MYDNFNYYLCGMSSLIQNKKFRLIIGTRSIDFCGYETKTIIKGQMVRTKFIKIEGITIQIEYSILHHRMRNR